MIAYYVRPIHHNAFKWLLATYPDPRTPTQQPFLFANATCASAGPTSASAYGAQLRSLAPAAQTLQGTAHFQLFTRLMDWPAAEMCVGAWVAVCPVGPLKITSST